MIKIYDYLIYIRDEYEFLNICKEIDKIYGFKHQYKFNTTPTGSVTETYTFEEEKKLYNTNHWCRYTKSILSILSIYNEQKAGIGYLFENRIKYKDVYSFVNCDVAKELKTKYPKMNEYEDKLSWGAELKDYYEAGYNYYNPRIREINCDLIDLECDNCFKEFTICGNPYDFDENEKVQCPYCKSELNVNKEYEIVLTTSKIR